MNQRGEPGRLSQDHAKGLPRIDIPVVLLGRLAIDGSLQRMGLGEFLLVDALRRCELLSHHVGVRAVEVDAIDEAAKQFYEHKGFIALQDNP